MNKSDFKSFLVFVLGGVLSAVIAHEINASKQRKNKQGISMPSPRVHPLDTNLNIVRAAVIPGPSTTDFTAMVMPHPRLHLRSKNFWNKPSNMGQAF